MTSVVSSLTRIRLDRGSFALFLSQATVGTGAENIVDGPPEEALLAQPSGIAVDEDYVMYVADSESSSIRAVK